MEYNLQNNENEPVIIKEQSNSSHAIWYWILALLLLGLIGWYAYSAGWFSPRDNGGVTTIPVEGNNGIGDGAVAINAAPIDSLRIETLESFPVQQMLVVSGTLPNGCTYLNTPTQLRDGNIFYVTLDTRVEGELCTEGLVPYEERIPLQVTGLPAGVYVVNINGREISFELENDNVLDFNAGEGK